mgnify:CR=1 FL=1
MADLHRTIDRSLRISRTVADLLQKRVRKASDELTKIFDSLMAKVQTPSAPSIFSEITDEDIDKLFG